ARDGDITEESDCGAIRRAESLVPRFSRGLGSRGRPATEQPHSVSGSLAARKCYEDSSRDEAHHGCDGEPVGAGVPGAAFSDYCRGDQSDLEGADIFPATSYRPIRNIVCVPEIPLDVREQ